MAESLYHKKLVELVVGRAKKLVPERKQGMILVDSDVTPLPTSIYGGVCPDVYYCDGDIMVLGEAKTFKDIDKRHSIHQYEKYIATIEAFEGLGYFILCVHWDCFLYAQKIMKNLLPKSKIGKYIIVSENGRDVIL